MHTLFLGRGIFAVPFFFIFFSLSLCAELPALGTKPALSLQEIAADAYWKALLHYKEGFFIEKSTIDDPRFFLSEKGQTDPFAELQATIEAFSSGDASDKEHPINRFPARLNWLRNTLPSSICSQFIAEKSIPFEETWDSIDPQAASVIFPAQYMNNPASLFGHTLINIEGKQNEKLLAYSINYSAITSETNGVVFAVKGIFGQYEGRFSIDPYYQKVQQYSDISMRDIWEYELNLEDYELRNLMLHLWELQEIYSYYYFFNENCSYNLLFLLDVARPGSKLTKEFSHWVIPVDTIKAVRKADFIATEKYRPSRSTKIKRIASTLPVALQQKSYEAIKGEKESIELTNSLENKEDKIRTLDLTSELLKMYYADGDMPQEIYADRFLGVLRQRATLGKVADDFYPSTTPNPPHQGHDSSRIKAGFGSYDGDSFISFSLRPAYHDLMDPSEGYTAGSAIEFLSGDFYYYTEEESLEIRELNFLSIHSISPVDLFFKSKSWKVNLGLTTLKEEESDDRNTAFYFDSGIGLSIELWKNTIAYTFVEPAIYIHDDLASGHMAGAGASVGILSHWTTEFRTQFEARQRYYLLGEQDSFSELSASTAYTISPNSALQLIWNYTNEFDKSWNEFRCELQFYF